LSIMCASHLYGRETITAETNHKAFVTIVKKHFLMLPNGQRSTSRCPTSLDHNNAEAGLSFKDQSLHFNVTDISLRQIVTETKADDKLQDLEKIVISVWPDLPCRSLCGSIGHSEMN